MLKEYSTDTHHYFLLYAISGWGKKGNTGRSKKIYGADRIQNGIKNGRQ